MLELFIHARFDDRKVELVWNKNLPLSGIRALFATVRTSIFTLVQIIPVLRFKMMLFDLNANIGNLVILIM